MVDKNLAWLRTRVSNLVNFDVTQPDQDFTGPASEPNQLIDGALSEVYMEEINRARFEAAKDWFKVDFTFTWAADTSTLDLTTLSSDLSTHSIIELSDETDDSEGTPIWVRHTSYESPVSWRNRTTLQWGTSGPGSARTIRAVYMASPQDLSDPLQEPYLVPPEYRWLLVWGAAVILRDMADEEAPARWVAKRDELREVFHLALAQGKVQQPAVNVIRDEFYQPGGFN
jgi:hypothetical protein